MFHFQDPKAVFIAMELPPTDSKTLQIHYASQAGREATDRFASTLLGKMVQKSGTGAQHGAKDREPKYFVSSLTCDLKQYHDEPMVAFIFVIATLLGQGLLL